MADATLSATDNVIITCNSGATSSNSRVVRIEHYSTGAMLAEFAESGTLTVTGTLKKAGVHILDNTLSGDGTILALHKNSTSRLLIDYISGTGVVIESASSTDDNVVLKSANHLIIILDHDDDGGAGADKFEIRDASDTTRFLVQLKNDDQYFSLNDQYGYATHVGSYNPGNDEAVFRVGGSSVNYSLRGKLFLSHHSEEENERPGVLALHDKNGTPWYVWADTNGKLRISSTDPNTSDTSGTVVGTQS